MLRKPSSDATRKSTDKNTVVFNIKNWGWAMISEGQRRYNYCRGWKQYDALQKKPKRIVFCSYRWMLEPSSQLRASESTKKSLAACWLATFIELFSALATAPLQRSSWDMLHWVFEIRYLFNNSQILRCYQQTGTMIGTGINNYLNLYSHWDNKYNCTTQTKPII